MFSNLLRKMLDGEPLTEIEKQNMVFEARRIEQAESLLSSLIVPGTQTLVIRNLQTENIRISNGDVLLDDAGISIKNNSEAALSFDNADGERGTIYIVSGLSNELALVNTNTDGEIILKQAIPGATSSSPFIRIAEDAELSGRVLVFIGKGESTVGTKLRIEGGANSGGILGLFGGIGEDLIEFRAEGSSGGSSFGRFRETSNTPEGPSAGDAIHFYMKDDKFIVQFNDGGTMRYKFLDLTGTGVTWQHATTAP